MKKLYILAIALIGAFAFGQGLETFENHNVPEGNDYYDGSYVGDNGITWNYVHVIDEQDFPIDGKGILLRRANEPSRISANIEGGIGDFSVDVRKAYTGNSQRRLALLINGEIVGEFTHQFAADVDDTVLQFTVSDINIEGEFELILQIGGEDTGNRQVVIDNLSWTSYEGGASVKDNHIAGLSVYPNPVATGTLYVTSDNSVEKTVAIFDVLGKQVVSTTTANGTVNVSNLTAGVYIVKVTEEGKTATRKLVVK